MIRITWHFQRLFNIILTAVSLLVALGVGELVLRYYFARNLMVHEEERSLLYRFDDRLGWFPKTDSINAFTGSRTVSVVHNSRGFRDIEHTRNDKPGIAFIGDSFVWGYDAEQSERFTEKLRSKISGWEVYNLGVSGYSTDQEYLLLKQQYDYYKPRLVFLVFCTYNDDYDNTTNTIGDGTYYKPYFEVYDQKIYLEGVPVPKSLTYFARQHPLLAKSYVVRLLIRATSPKIVRKEFPPTAAILQEMDDYLRQQGSRLVVGLLDRQPSLEQFMENQNIPYVQLAGAERYPTHGWHWTPAGHITVSDKIYDYLQNAGLLVTEKIKQQ